MSEPSIAWSRGKGVSRRWPRLHLACIAFLLALPLLTGTAHAKSDVTIFHVKGDAATAFFESLDGCIVTDVTLNCLNGTIDELPGGKTSNLLVGVIISVFNQCTGFLVIDGNGSTVDASFQVAVDLSSATATATVPFFDTLSGNLFNVDVNAVWTGIGPVQHIDRTYHDNSPGFVADGHFSGFTNTANATATITDGTTNFTPEPALSAEIDKNTIGNIQVQIQH
jgi:hypothetical protein